MTTEERLARVERQLRWLKRLGALAIAVGAVVVLGGQAAKKPPDVVKAREFIVVDSKGHTRAKLEVSEAVEAEGVPQLTLRDQEGWPTLVLMHTPSGPVIQMNDKRDGKASVTLGLPIHGHPLLVMRHGKACLRGTVAKHPLLYIANAKGEMVWDAP
jgi:hypothetical protein